MYLMQKETTTKKRQPFVVKFNGPRQDLMIIAVVNQKKTVARNIKLQLKETSLNCGTKGVSDIFSRFFGLWLVCYRNRGKYQKFKLN